MNSRELDLICSYCKKILSEDEIEFNFEYGFYKQNHICASCWNKGKHIEKAKRLLEAGI